MIGATFAAIYELGLSVDTPTDQEAVVENFIASLLLSILCFEPAELVVVYRCCGRCCPCCFDDSELEATEEGGGGGYWALGGS